MKLVQAILVRDEADVVGTQIEYHLNAGVDFVIAMDHDSVDGTTEILEEYAGQGVLRRIPVCGEMQQTPWRTRMARLAASEHAADWVIHTDADEFWVPRRGSLKSVFEAIPPRFGVIWALSRQFVPRPGEGSFAERMTVRVSASAPINDPISPYRPHAKVAHRGSREIVVRHGAHLVSSRDLEPMREWYPVDCLHFPFRSVAHYVQKCTRQAVSFDLGQYTRGALATERGRAEDAYRALLVTDDEVQRGVAAGLLAVDTRLRDALCSAAGSATGATSRTQADVDVVAEAAALQEANVVRCRRNLDALHRRVSGLEHRRQAILR